MNEVLFVIQALIVMGFAIGAFKLGKSALIAWMSVLALIANLFVLKQIMLFGFHVTASDVFAIGSLLVLNFLQEDYGKDAAKQATWICFFCMIFFAIISQLHLFYQPSPYDNTQEAYLVLLSPSPRLLIASLSVFFVVQRIDIRFFEFLKKRLPRANFTVRASISLVVSQFLDTVLFSFVGLYGLMASITDIIFISFVIKLFVIFCFTPLLRWAKA
ncbi:MAG: hypothetical protein BGO14_06095 [Chlamydiales bacterium 38-26]|nr:queuosine precursor transporter [Chlamydiales bacterium]OJV08463.1 MAG: hypothetical protein BGO14_06095 [Chlamydiales bacterium 38-26]